MRATSMVGLSYACCALMGMCNLASAAPASTQISYQGQLKQAGVPVTDQCDFVFELWDQETGGSRIGQPLSRNGIGVQNGLFSVTDLNFGQNAWLGPTQYLLISVRCPAGAVNVGFSAFPRQLITASPYALQLHNVSVDAAGNVGIGTAAPGKRLHVAAASTGDGILVSGSNAPGVSLEGVDPGFFPSFTPAYGWCELGMATFDGAYSADAQFGDTVLRSRGWGPLSHSIPPGLVGDLRTRLILQNGDDNAGLVLSDNNVGIGTTSPIDRLTVVGNGSQISCVDGAVRTRLFSAASTGAGYLATSSNHSLVLRTHDVDRMIIDNAGNVGIGTNNPDARLRVSGGDIKLDHSATIWSAGRLHVQAGAADDHLFLNPFHGDTHIGGGGGAGRLHVHGGNLSTVSIGSDVNGNGSIELREIDGSGVPYIDFSNENSSDFDARIILWEDDKLEVAGATFAVPVLEIFGGSDLSESFDVSGPDIEPGMVVTIDAEKPGKLKRSERAYDRTVAGVVSGAGGVQTGMIMGQKGSLADGAHNIALTGRVYCWCDASSGAVEPGDLLTTSSTPGHAMKVADHAKAQGAIIGKAMTTLEAGKGLVLVLVSLQ